MILPRDLAELVAAGLKTEHRLPARPGRDAPYEAGTTYPTRAHTSEWPVARIRVTSVHQERLDDLDEAALEREGAVSRSAYVERWVRIHGCWVPSWPVWVVRFELAAPRP